MMRLLCVCVYGEVNGMDNTKNIMTLLTFTLKEMCFW